MKTLLLETTKIIKLLCHNDKHCLITKILRHNIKKKSELIMNKIYYCLKNRVYSSFKIARIKFESTRKKKKNPSKQ